MNGALLLTASCAWNPTSRLWDFAASNIPVTGALTKHPWLGTFLAAVDINVNNLVPQADSGVPYFGDATSTD